MTGQPLTSQFCLTVELATNFGKLRLSYCKLIIVEREREKERERDREREREKKSFNSLTFSTL